MPSPSSYIKVKRESKICSGCGDGFFALPKQRFCNPKCRKGFYDKGYRKKNPLVSTLPNGTVGAMHELLVAVDLLRLGFCVFRAISPNSPCDLAILKDKELIMIEVTTGARSVKGNLTYPLHKKYAHIYDVLAVVERGGKITYLPDSPNAI